MVVTSVEGPEFFCSFCAILQFSVQYWGWGEWVLCFLENEIGIMFLVISEMT